MNDHGQIPDGYHLIESGETLESGDMYWYPYDKKWRLLEHGFGKEKPSHWYSFIIKPNKKPSVNTMEHQDGATTTTVSVGDVQSKFERDGRVYEISDITEVVSSTGRREIQIKATHNPALGQSPIKPAMDALDAVAEASKRLVTNYLKNTCTDTHSHIEMWSPAFREKYAAHQENRKQEIASIIKSVVEKLA